MQLRKSLVKLQYVTMQCALIIWSALLGSNYNAHDMTLFSHCSMCHLRALLHLYALNRESAFSFI